MFDAITKAFPRRRHDNGMYDSICPRCFRTVIRKRNESQLAEIERQHVCGSTGDWDPNFEDLPSLS
jgi:hypothetical protein